MLRVDRGAVDALNGGDPALTLATLPDRTRVRAGQMVATVKIIPYGVAGAELARAVRRLATACAAPIRLHRFRPGRAALILTTTPGLKPSLIASGAAAVEARLAALGQAMAPPVTVPHETAAVAAAIADAPGDLVLILGASATSDAADACPAALVAAGGRLIRFGMPVDPGNLLFLGEQGGRPVVGLPGCARSPALNGADWVLERLAAGLTVTGPDIAAMGVGGLLKEIAARPQPRAGRTRPPGRRGSRRWCSPPAPAAGCAAATSCSRRSAAARRSASSPRPRWRAGPNRWSSSCRRTRRRGLPRSPASRSRPSRPPTGPRAWPRRCAPGWRRSSRAPTRW